MTRSVCVIVTCYNLERYIEEAVRSVWAQDFDGQVDLLVVDDCSTDSSLAILERLQQQGPLRCIRAHANCGVLMATVTGLRHTTASIVCFLDGDDVWEPGKLSAVVQAFEADPGIALVTHDLHYIDDAGQLLQHVSRPREVMDPANPLRQGQQVQRGILEHGDYVWLGSAFAVRRSVADVSGFCAYAEALPDAPNTYQDWPLAYWAVSRPGVRCGYVAAPLFRYRLHGRNHSGDATDAAKAIRNVTRTFNTMQAIDGIPLGEVLSHEARQATRRKLRYHGYLCDLYRGRRLKAVAGFMASLPYLLSGVPKGERFKELGRFVLIQCLGLQGFIRMRAART